MANFTYVLTEKSVYDSSGGKLKDAIDSFNKMNEEGYEIVQDLERFVDKRDPNIEIKLDKAISYLRNIQSVYDKMDSFIDTYMENEMKETPEIASSIKLDCEMTKKSINDMRKKDQELIQIYTKQKKELHSKESNDPVIKNILTKIKAVFTLHKKAVPRLTRIYGKVG